MFIKILLLFILILIIKASYNLYYLFSIKKYFNKYCDYLNNHKDWYITRNKQKIVALLKKANVKDSFLPSAEPIGFGYVQTGNFSVFDNLALIRVDVVRTVGQFLKEAEGVFLNRLKETFNPIFWFELFIFLPKNIFNYLGIKEKSFIINFFQLFWWLLNLVSIIVGIFFNHEFILWVNNLN